MNLGKNDGNLSQGKHLSPPEVTFVLRRGHSAETYYSESKSPVIHLSGSSAVGRVYPNAQRPKHQKKRKRGDDRNDPIVIDIAVHRQRGRKSRWQCSLH